MRFSKWVVAMIITMNALFCLAVLYINYRGFYVSDALIAAWFGFTTAELWGLAFIKGKEIKHADSDSDCDVDIDEDLKGEDIDG